VLASPITFKDAVTASAQTGSRGLLGRCGIALLSSLVAMFGLGGPAASAMVRIADDSGGPMGAYLERFASIRDSREHVIIDGFCLSACTLVLAMIPPDRICLTPKAVFGFHAASSSQQWLYPQAGSAGTRTLWALYPESIRKLIRKKGGLSNEMVYLTAQELSSGFSRCDEKHKGRQ